MPNDPGLADTCFHMNDGNPWWLSPDIILNSGPMLDKADVGPNTVGVRFHRLANCTPSPTPDAVIVELYICDPAIAIAPPPFSKDISGAITGVTPLPAAGTSHTHTINWVIPNSPTPPETPGHKCLVARCYPDTNTPSSTNFFVPDDPHVAQRNICIIPCGRPGAARKPGDCTFTAQTTNVNPREPEEVRIISWFDGQPNDYVRGIVMEHMRRVPGFNRLATRPPNGFKQRLPDFPDAKVLDNTRPAGCLGQLFSGRRERTYEVQARLGPGQRTDVRFSADFTGAEFGDAHIFHLKQVGRDGRDQGGLTVVMVVG